MAFTYSGNPSSSVADEVRFLSGDVDPDNQMCQDAEINYLVAEWGSDPYYAAAGVCDFAAAKAAAKADYSRGVGSLSLTTMYSQQSQNLILRATALRNQAMFQIGSPIPTVSSDALGSFEFSIDMDNNNGN